ncbi:MAG TPA: class I SAM-dependent methyltransferase [Candidatus Paceibacterota bacterium]|nr:class I SAM-dependent methyltransferase [Candidatus Paceibacterota bacterium]
MNEKRLKEFWNKEYKDPGMFGLSEGVSEALPKFCRWLESEFGDDYFKQKLTVLDAGCGNGRNLLWMNEQFGVAGYGYDISEEAIAQANRAKEKQPFGNRLTFAVRSLSASISLPDESVDIVFDLMSSHFLREEERVKFLSEISRVLKPAGMLLFKSFYKEGDRNAAKLIKEGSAGEKNAYIHPRMKVYEYVWDDAALAEAFGSQFIMRAKFASHKHNVRGKPGKRRSITCYFEKK